MNKIMIRKNRVALFLILLTGGFGVGYYFLLASSVVPLQTTNQNENENVCDCTSLELNIMELHDKITLLNQKNTRLQSELELQKQLMMKRELEILKSQDDHNNNNHNNNNSNNSGNDNSISRANNPSNELYNITSYNQLVNLHWSAFDLKYEFVPTDKSPVNSLKHQSKYEIDRVVSYATEWLRSYSSSLSNSKSNSNNNNNEFPSTQPAITEFILKQGWRNHNRARGTEYVLDFSSPTLHTVQRVYISKPFVPSFVLHKSTVFTIDTSLKIRTTESSVNISTKPNATPNENTIFFIVPIAGRLPQLRVFLTKIIALASEDGNFGLILVNFDNHPDSNPTQLQSLVQGFKLNRLLSFQIIHITGEDFSRSKGLSTGVSKVQDVFFGSQGSSFGETLFKEDVFSGSSPYPFELNSRLINSELPDRDALLFFCDVDMDINIGFFQECRQNTIRGSQIYSPIVFSLYQDQTSKIDMNAGLWRSFGFGMMCLHKSDFNSIEGFGSKTYFGWGNEDVDLIDRFLAKGYKVFRAASKNLFHVWHNKVCDPTQLTEKALKSCRKTKLLHMGSAETLATELVECRSQQRRV